MSNKIYQLWDGFGHEVEENCFVSCVDNMEQCLRAYVKDNEHILCCVDMDRVIDISFDGLLKSDKWRSWYELNVSFWDYMDDRQVRKLYFVELEIDKLDYGE